MLNTAGIVTRAINNPLEIFDALTHFKPEIILMDMYMPGCNGTELARVVRQESRFTSIPIVFLSSEDDIDVQIAAMSHGADDFLTKPIRPKHLQSTIRTKAERARSLVSIMKRDSLTGLLNHTSVLHELEAEIQKAKQSQYPLCFTMIDIDHFKQVNDNYGHPVGDKIIRSLSLFLKQRLRKSDSIGRYGGEEFAIVLPNTTLEQAVSIFEDIRLRFSQFIHTTDTIEIKSTFSGGIALLQAHPTHSIIVMADQALYQSKREGRNRICTAPIYSDYSYSDRLQIKA
jgi:diguanylate cyclase (GGDEF)-like protein